MTGEERPRRADARRNAEALLKAANAAFAASGVDAPVREIADKAGVGVATVYRAYPTRAHLIAAVFRREIDACADDAVALGAGNPPGEALALWAQRYVEFIAAKRGLASALHSGDPAFDALPAHFDARLRPALRDLLGAAVAAGEMRGEFGADELLGAITGLCASERGPDHARRMVALLIDGLRYGSASP